jgi:hypothetical protein
MKIDHPHTDLRHRARKLGHTYVAVKDGKLLTSGTMKALIKLEAEGAKVLSIKDVVGITNT